MAPGRVFSHPRAVRRTGTAKKMKLTPLVRPMKSIRAKTVLAVLATAWLTGAQSADGGGGPGCDLEWLPEIISPPLEAPFVFETFELSDGSGRRYEVRLPFCGDARCPIEVRLRDDDTVHDTVQFDECANAQRPSRSKEDWILGVGDPLRPDNDIRVWDTGYEDFIVSLHARPIDLAADRRGVLLHIIGGFEHTWRNHYLLVARDNRLILAWSASEIAGVGLVAIDLADVDGNGYPEILYFYGTYHGWRDQASDETLAGVEAAVYRWNDDTGKIEGLTLAAAGIPIYAAVGGMFDTVVPVKDVWRNSASCFWLYYALSTGLLPELKPDRYILAMFTWDRALAEKQLDACNPAGYGFVAELTEFPAPLRLENYPAAPTP